MDMIEQIFNKDLELKGNVDIGRIDEHGKNVQVEVVFSLKRHFSQSDLNDLSINATRDDDDYIGSPKKQALLIAQFSLIKKFMWDDVESDLINSTFLDKITAVRILFNTINDQLRELKKK